MEPIELFLSPADEGGQTLENGLHGDSMAEVDVQEASKVTGAETFLDPGGDLGSLVDQGWGVVAPAGAHGDRLLEVIEPLIDKRRQDMESDGQVKVYRAPAGMHAPAALKWRNEHVIGNNDIRDIPGYLLVVGDLDGVSIETQQVLSTQYNVGRLGFAEEAHYESYIHKLLRWEQIAPAGEARALFFSAMDGTAATRLGHSHLVRPLVADAQVQQEAGKLAVSEIVHLHDEDPADAGNLLLEQAQRAESSILFSCSHGMGAPRRGWGANVQRQRALQGALCLGGGEYIAADDLANTSFLPGGMWIFFACFGAGTPAVSEYRHWLSRLKKVGQFGGSIDSVLAALPRDGDPPFIAALPRAVLASPDGPLAVIGHVDLAWSYSFQALDGETSHARDSRFRPIVRDMARGRRAGLALRPFLLARAAAKDDLVASVDQATRAAEQGRMAPDDRKHMGHTWMMHQDLNGYVLLGDPAARMAVSPGPRKRRRDVQSTAPVPEIRSAEPASAVQPVATEPAMPAARHAVEAFGWFGKDKDKESDSDGGRDQAPVEPAEREPGFIARFTQKVGETLSNVLTDAVTLDVKTYIGSNVQALPAGEHEMDAHPDVYLLAYTRSKLDGDVYQFWATDEDGDTEQIRHLRSLHLKMLEQAQAHRNELLRILLSMFRPGA